MNKLIKGMAPTVYENPLRVTSRGFVSLLIAIIAAYVVLTVFGFAIPPQIENLVALVIGYGGARTLKQ